jgi:hypothetical protein
MQLCAAGCDLTRAMQAGRDAGQGYARFGLAQEWRWRLLLRDGNPIFRPASTRASTGRRRSPVWGTATNGARPTKADRLKGRTRARSLVRCTRDGELEGEAAKRRRRPDAMSSEEPRCSQARRALSIHAEVEAGVK